MILAHNGKHAALWRELNPGVRGRNAHYHPALANWFQKRQRHEPPSPLPQIDSSFRRRVVAAHMRESKTALQTAQFLLDESTVPENPSWAIVFAQQGLLREARDSKAGRAGPAPDHLPPNARILLESIAPWSADEIRWLEMARNDILYREGLDLGISELHLHFQSAAKFSEILMAGGFGGTIRPRAPGANGTSPLPNQYFDCASWILNGYLAPNQASAALSLIPAFNAVYRSLLLLLSRHELGASWHTGPGITYWVLERVLRHEKWLEGSRDGIAAFRNARNQVLHRCRLDSVGREAAGKYVEFASSIRASTMRVLNGREPNFSFQAFLPSQEGMQ